MPWNWVYDCPSCCDTYWTEIQGVFFCEICGCPLELRRPKTEGGRALPTTEKEEPESDDSESRTGLSEPKE